LFHDQVRDFQPPFSLILTNHLIAVQFRIVFEVDLIILTLWDIVHYSCLHKKLYTKRYAKKVRLSTTFQRKY
jgi:hypothetical protein